MSNLEIDHIFCFCDPVLDEVGIATKAGFTFSPEVIHSGQGTGNRAILFAENYLELLHEVSRKEMTANPLRLDRRADWRKTGASPFGIALRGELSAEDAGEFVIYDPPYRPGKPILIHKNNDLHPEQPFVFFMPDAKGAPKWSNLSLLEHANSSRRILEIEISGPGYTWPLIRKPEIMKVENGARPQMRVQIDAGMTGGIALNDCLFILS